MKSAEIVSLEKINKEKLIWKLVNRISLFSCVHVIMGWRPKSLLTRLNKTNFQFFTSIRSLNRILLWLFCYAGVTVFDLMALWILPSEQYNTATNGLSECKIFYEVIHSPVRFTELRSEEFSVPRKRLRRQTDEIIFVDFGQQQYSCETQQT